MCVFMLSDFAVPHVVFLYFQMCVMNAAVLNRIDNPEKALSDLKFREVLVNEILESTGPHPAVRNRFQPPSMASNSNLAPRLTQRHFPTAIPLTDNAKAKGKKHCFRVCHLCKPVSTIENPRKRVETPYQCASCNVALCIDPCFRLYHTQQNPSSN